MRRPAGTESGASGAHSRRKARIGRGRLAAEAPVGRDALADRPPEYRLARKPDRPRVRNEALVGGCGLAATSVASALLAIGLWAKVPVGFDVVRGSGLPDGPRPISSAVPLDRPRELRQSPGGWVPL